jgi:hypothetical protein
VISDGSYEHGNEPSGSIEGGEFLDRLSDCLRRHLLHSVSYELLYYNSVIVMRNFACSFHALIIANIQLAVQITWSG